MPIDVLRRFYDAFAERDHAAMARCYAPNAHFSDPVFPDLRGPQVSGMWRMLCERAVDFRVESRDFTSSGDQGTAHWEAWYTYSATGRRVHNIIDATFTFQDGLIVRHEDHFNLYAWSRQALGSTGALLGWTPFVQHKIRRQAAAALARAMAAGTPA